MAEWRHWLEGGEIVWTNDRNLVYIHGVKRLHSRKARWALFFTCFAFSLSYHPGSHNGKPGALSRQFDVDGHPQDAATILPQDCVIRAVTWGMEKEVQCALLMVWTLTDVYLANSSSQARSILES